MLLGGWMFIEAAAADSKVDAGICEIDIVTAFDAVHGLGSALQPLQRQHRLS